MLPAVLRQLVPFAVPPARVADRFFVSYVVPCCLGEPICSLASACEAIWVAPTIYIPQTHMSRMSSRNLCEQRRHRVYVEYSVFASEASLVRHTLCSCGLQRDRPFPCSGGDPGSAAPRMKSSGVHKPKQASQNWRRPNMWHASSLSLRMGFSHSHTCGGVIRVARLEMPMLSVLCVDTDDFREGGSQHVFQRPRDIINLASGTSSRSRPTPGMRQHLCLYLLVVLARPCCARANRSWL